MRTRWVTILLIAVSSVFSACSSPVSINPPPTSPAPQQTPQTTAPEITSPLFPSQPVDDLPLRIISLTSPINPGVYATLVVETLPGAECSAIVDYGPSGVAVLRTQTVDGDGKVSWTWMVGKFSGTWQVVVKASFDGKTASQITSFIIRP